MNAAEKGLRALIRESITQILNEDTAEHGTLEFQTGPDPGTESDIPYTWTPRSDNQIIIRNTEPRSLLSVTLDNVRGSVTEKLVDLVNLSEGEHRIIGREDMGFATLGLFHLWLRMTTQNGNELTSFHLLDRKPVATGFELTVGR